MTPRTGIRLHERLDLRIEGRLYRGVVVELPERRREGLQHEAFPVEIEPVNLWPAIADLDFPQVSAGGLSFTDGFGS
jgi:hypothetical protein